MRFSTLSALSFAVLGSLSLTVVASPTPIHSSEAPALLDVSRREVCRKDKDCNGAIPPRSKATCDEGTCSWRCQGDFTKSGNRCLRTCKDKECPDVLNGRGVCNIDAVTCGTQCNSGFTLVAGVCVPQLGGCGGQTCVSLPFGTATCSKKNVCTYKCDASAGYTLVDILSIPTCILRETRSDVNNCGALGNVCDGDYTGRGLAQCLSGTCTLRCPKGLSAFTGPPPFCG